MRSQSLAELERKQKKHLKEKVGFETFSDMMAWSKGKILIGVGEGKYEDAVWAVVNAAVLWGGEVARYNDAQKKGKK